VASWRDVRRYALAMPGAREGRSSAGKCVWTVSEKFFAWERPLRRSDIDALGAKAPSGPILLVRTSDLEMKEVLLASDPDVFFTTPHFDGFPGVLIRLAKITPKKLKAVIVESWLARAPKRAAAQFLSAVGR
jgi:hypothetical protein